MSRTADAGKLMAENGPVIGKWSAVIANDSQIKLCSWPYISRHMVIIGRLLIKIINFYIKRSCLHTLRLDCLRRSSRWSWGNNHLDLRPIGLIYSERASLTETTKLLTGLSEDMIDRAVNKKLPLQRKTQSGRSKRSIFSSWKYSFALERERELVSTLDVLHTYTRTAGTWLRSRDQLLPNHRFRFRWRSSGRCNNYIILLPTAFDRIKHPGQWRYKSVLRYAG